VATWLMKSEPNAYSIDDLKRDKKTMWDGVRNYQARNFMRSMAIGDEILFYHSNCDVPGVVGLAKVVRLAYVDPTQFDPSDKHYDPASKPADPRWSLVDIGFAKKFERTVSLTELKARADELGDFALTRTGNRLSVMSVTQAQFDLGVSLAVS
jgi:predicted RNA-binding protein with PUA-like domain